MKIDDLQGLSEVELKEKLKEFLTSENSDFDWYDFDKEYENVFGEKLYSKLFENVQIASDIENSLTRNNYYSDFETRLSKFSYERHHLKSWFTNGTKDNPRRWNDELIDYAIGAEDLKTFISNFVEAAKNYLDSLQANDDVWGGDVPKKEEEAKTELIQINNELI